MHRVMRYAKVCRGPKNRNSRVHSGSRRFVDHRKQPAIDPPGLPCRRRPFLHVHAQTRVRFPQLRSHKSVPCIRMIMEKF